MVAFRKKFQPFVQQLIFFSIEYMYIYILYIYRYRYITYTMYIIYIYIYYITYMYIRSLKILINLEVSKYFYPEEAFGRNQSRLKLCFTYQYIPCIFQVIYIYMYIYIYIYIFTFKYVYMYIPNIDKCTCKYSHISTCCKNPSVLDPEYSKIFTGYHLRIVCNYKLRKPTI